MNKKETAQQRTERLRSFQTDHEPDGWPAVRMRDITALLDHIDELQADKARIDWLADRDNHIGNVQLPMACVEANIESLRGAIDMAMAMGAEMKP